MASQSPMAGLVSLWTLIRIYSIGILGAMLLRLINFTLRWKIVGFDGKEKIWPSDKPRIVAFWHSQQLLMPWIYLKHLSGKTNRPFVALISQHGDGRMIASVMRFLGIDSIAGSSSRSGLASLYELVDRLKAGSHIAITPDGPKGPAFQAKGGVVRIAQKSGAMVYPAAIASQDRWTFKSWDKMFLPKPFSRAVLIMGNGISIPTDLEASQVSDYTNQVEKSLNDLSKMANEYQY